MSRRECAWPEEGLSLAESVVVAIEHGPNYAHNRFTLESSDREHLAGYREFVRYVRSEGAQMTTLHRLSAMFSADFGVLRDWLDRGELEGLIHWVADARTFETTHAIGVKPTARRRARWKVPA